MKIYSFLRLLNYKIKQYEKTASNPFGGKYNGGKYNGGKYNGGTYKYPQTVIWVENFSTSERSSEQQ